MYSLFLIWATTHINNHIDGLVQHCGISRALTMVIHVLQSFGFITKFVKKTYQQMSYKHLWNGALANSHFTLMSRWMRFFWWIYANPLRICFNITRFCFSFTKQKWSNDRKEINIHVPIHFTDFRGGCVQHLWNAQVKGQLNQIAHVKGQERAKMIVTQLCLFQYKCAPPKVLSIHMIEIGKIITNSEIIKDVYFI